MASINVNASGMDALLASVRRQVESKWEAQGEAAAEAGRFGAKTAQSYTATRPGATTGKAGRIESGSMIDALRTKPVSFSPSEIHVQYGFVDEFEAYYKMQTITGFTHNRSGKTISPTFALRDSIEPTKAFARDAAGRAA